ncbi:tetratricopeptide repeat protein [Pseudothermotoga sp. U03pept]|uniref:tetratricopeptide repeat protein n=1 Tax=Pseudothermotoga sp. U03pept TaxID=3447012 RepID=UPI003F0A0EDE
MKFPRRSKSIKAIVYLPLDPEKAKKSNLPVKLPVLVDDFPTIVDTNQIPIDVVIRGLEAQYEISKDPYYESYLVYFYYEKVKVALNNDDLKGAEEWLEKAGRLIKDYRYDFFRGLIAAKLKDYEAAEILIRSSVAKNQNFVLGYYELGNILMAKKEFEDAIMQYQRAFELEKTFLLPLLRIGDCYMEMGEIRQACDFYQVITQLDSEFSQAYSRLGVACNILQRFEHAEKALRKALNLTPNDSAVAFNLSYTLSKLGKHFEAMNLLKKLVDKEPENPSFLNEYALMLRRLGFYEEAKEIIDKTKELSDEQSVLFNQVLLTFFVDKDEALSLSKDLSQDYRARIDDLISFLRQWDGSIVVPHFMEEKVKTVRSSMIGSQIDVQRLAHFIRDGERIEVLRQGLIPSQDTSIDTVRWLEILVAVMLATPRDPIEIEKNVTKTAVALYGSGIMLAVAIGLTRVLFHIKSNGYFDLSVFLQEVVSDLQEYHWEFAKRVSRIEEESFSFEDLNLKPEKGSDLFIELLKALSMEVPKEIEDGLLKDLYTIFRMQWR